MPAKGRPVRFARALGGLQRALNSFGISSTACLTVSSVEALMWWKLKSARVMDDRAEVVEIIDRSNVLLGELIDGCEGRVLMFDHMDLVKESWETSDGGVFVRVEDESDIGNPALHRGPDPGRYLVGFLAGEHPGGYSVSSHRAAGFCYCRHRWLCALLADWLDWDVRRQTDDE